MSFYNAAAIRGRIAGYERAPGNHVAVKVRAKDAAVVLRWAIEHSDESRWGALDFPIALELFVTAALPVLPRPRAVSRGRT